MAGLRQIILPVDDVSGAVAHYGEALGLPVRFQDGERWAVLDAGAVALALAGAGEQPADRIALGVKVTDLDAAVNDVVRDGGVVLDPPRDGEHERRAACRDRFGTVLAFYEPRAT